MSDEPAKPAVPYLLTFVTNEWEWDEKVKASVPDEAIAYARETLEAVVAEEQPSLAFVTVVQGGRRLGIWDWVGDQFTWSPEA